MGLSVNNDFLACGSETNEVYGYHKVSDNLLVNFFLLHVKDFTIIPARNITPALETKQQCIFTFDAKISSLRLMNVTMLDLACIAKKNCFVISNI